MRALFVLIESRHVCGNLLRTREVLDLMEHCTVDDFDGFCHSSRGLLKDKGASRVKIEGVRSGVANRQRYYGLYNTHSREDPPHRVKQHQRRGR